MAEAAFPVRTMLGLRGKPSVEALVPLALIAALAPILALPKAAPRLYPIAFSLGFLSSIILSKRFLGSPGARGRLAKNIIFLLPLLVLLLSLYTSPAKAALIVEYPLAGDYRPRGIAIDGDGNVWFTEQYVSKIGKLSGGTIYEWEIPTWSEPWDIVAAPNGEVWFTDFYGNEIGRIKDSVFAEFGLTGDAAPMGITIDTNVPYSNIWFTEFSTGRIGRIYYNDTGDYWVLTEYDISTASGPMDIAVDSIKGFVWFTEYNARKIASFNPWTNVTREYDLPSGDLANFYPMDIAVDRDGFVWFTLDSTDPNDYDKIGKLNPWTAEIITYDVPTKDAGPRGMAIDGDGNIWFTEYNKGKIGRLNPTTRYITEFALPNSGAKPLGIAIASSGGSPIVWFTEWAGNKIGKLDPSLGRKFSTVTTITSATTTITTHRSTIDNVLPIVAAITVSSATVSFNSTISSATVLTPSTTTNTETVFIMPTTVVKTTTLIIASTSITSTTTTATLTSYVTTITECTTTTIKTVSIAPITTKTDTVTIEDIFTDVVSTRTLTEYSRTSFIFRTTTLPTYTQYSTSTISETTTKYTTTTTTLTHYITTTITITETVTTPIVMALGSALLLYFRRKRRWKRG